VSTWSEFETAAPEIAAGGRRLLAAREDGQALLATVRADDPPRIHPITVWIVDGHLYSFLLTSAKRIDLERDGRYALHTQQDHAAPDEFSIRGRAQRVDDRTVRDAVGGGWSFEVDDTYDLYELLIQSAILGLRRADEWPPRYSRWSEGSA